MTAINALLNQEFEIGFAIDVNLTQANMQIAISIVPLFIIQQLQPWLWG
jgi:hypothetical protein